MNSTQNPASTAASIRLGGWRRLFLVLLFLYLAVLGWSRVQQALQDWDLLVKYGASPGPLYAELSGGLWGVMGLVAAVLLYVRQNWARGAVFALALSFAATYWLDFLLLTRGAEEMVNWPFALALTLLGLAYCAWTVKIYRKTSADTPHPLS